eukprot:479017_1
MSSKFPDINWFIIDIFKTKEFFDVSTFIVKVLYCLQELRYVHHGKYLNIHQIKRQKQIMLWCRHVYHKYFKASDIPDLYSIICDRLNKDHVGTALKYSKIYLKQRNANKLSDLSQLCNKWRSTNESIFSFEEMHLICLRSLESHYFTAIRCHPNNQHTINNYTKYFVELMDYFIKNQQLCSNKAPEIIIPSLFDALYVILNIGRYGIRFGSNLFLQNIKILCQKYYKSIISQYDDWHKYDACLVLGCYYFWHTRAHNRNKAMKYMYEGLTCALNSKNRPNTIHAFIQDLYDMEWEIGNFEHCAQIIQLKCKIFPKTIVDPQKIKQLKQLKLEKEQNSIKHCANKLQKYARYQYEQLKYNIEQYISNERFNNMIRNLFELKHCNYIGCNTKDLRSFKLCKRCKSVFYCNRKHQKLDWNKNHRLHCVENDDRNYYMHKTKSEMYCNDRKQLMACKLWCEV